MSAADAVDGSSTGTEVPCMWVLLRPPRFGGAKHASGHDNRSRHRKVGFSSRMRAFHRDLIRGGHYGQRPCAPRLTGRTHGCTDQQCDVKISLAHSEPSTHGTKRTWRDVRPFA